MKEIGIFMIVFFVLIGILLITDPDKKQREQAFIKTHIGGYHKVEVKNEDKLQACIDLGFLVNAKTQRNKNIIISGNVDGSSDAQESILLSQINAVLCDPRNH